MLDVRNFENNILSIYVKNNFIYAIIAIILIYIYSTKNFRIFQMLCKQKINLQYWRLERSTLDI